MDRSLVLVRGKENLIISRVLDRFMLTDQLKRVNKRIIRTKLSKERREDVFGERRNVRS